MNVRDRADDPNPYWIHSTPQTDFPTLEEDIEVDVAVVGGGIVGITTAFLLKKAGIRVAVVEADHILNGTTGHSTAKITSQHSLIYARLKKEMGSELAGQYAEANQSAIQWIADTAEQYDIDCDFRWRPAFVYTQDSAYVNAIEKEAQVASEFGIMASIQEHLPIPMDIKTALRFDHQAQFHPLRFLKSLAHTIPGQGSYIFEGTAAVNLDGYPLAIVTKEGHRIRTEHVIIASHYPFFDGGGLYFSRIWTSRSYILAVRTRERFPDGMFISAESPARSLRSQSDKVGGDLVLVAGEEHKTGDGSNMNLHYQNLLDFIRQLYTVNDIPYRWSTQDCMTLDGVPYVGHLTSRTPHVYVATGFGKWGISNGIASAHILKDLIIQGDSPWAPVYNPTRFNLVSAKPWIVQNADVAREWVFGKFSSLPEHMDVPNGEARSLEIEGHKVGAYRDDQGELHLVDLTCTHLGCELKWNDAERTWDCPCHGSRFNLDGDILEGPAFNHLQTGDECPNHVEARVFQ